MKKKNTIVVHEMVVGGTYSTGDLSSTKQLAECPCCGKALRDHVVKQVTCVFAADQQPMGKKALCGRGCEPRVAPRPDRVVTLRVTTETGTHAAFGAIMWATRKMAYRTVERVNGHSYIVELGIPDDKGCQQVAKVARALGEICAVKAQSLDDGETWEPLDTATWSKRLGCGKYQGTKAYGV